MQPRKVAVTGLGIVSPLGNDVATTWNNLLAGCSGIGHISHFDASTFPTQIAAEVKKFKFRPCFHTKQNRNAIIFTQYALEAAQQALDDAALFPNKLTANQWGVIVGSGMMTAEFDYLHRFQRTCAQDGHINWHQLQQQSQNFYQLQDFGKTTSSSGLSLLAQQFGIQGYAASVHTACASGGQALGLALQVIRRGDADFILAGGFDSLISPLGLASFCLLGALSTYNDSPSTASRPFDATRNGFVLGEGAAFLVLEAWHLAQARGAKIYAEFAGEGNSLSSYRITDTHINGGGAIEAMENALLDANMQRHQVDYINAHGTSTIMNDLSETNAIKTVFKEYAYQLAISSTKSQTGHLIAAAGALEAAFSVLSIHHAKLPRTANLNVPDPACDLNYLMDGPQNKTVNAVLSNSFGFGGSNSCLVFKSPEF